MNQKLLTGAIAAMAFLLPSTAMGQTADFNIIPQPQQVIADASAPFVLNANTVICLQTNSQDMKRNASMLASYIKEATGITPTIGKFVKGSPAIVLSIDKTISNAEGYKLDSDAKQIRIAGASAAGVFYGIQTLRKSLPLCNGKATQVTIPAVHIADAPRFAYRGTHLDVSRHFVTADSIRQFIDMLALHNINRFHWHLTDDQGWRIEVKKYPDLAKIGSVREKTVLGHNSDVFDDTPYGGYYTQEEAREIVKYAADRFITVIPEIDMPGHMIAALAAYPDMGCTGGPYKVCQIWGVMPDVLCLGNEKTYQFCEDVLSEMMDIFPSEYIHLGGDETPNVRWKECPKCKALMAKENLTPGKLQGYFTNRIEKFVNSKGRRIIGWDEILDGDINQSATIMSWRGTAPGARGAKMGHDVIMSPSSHVYFDYYQTRQGESQWEEPLLIGGNLPIERTYSLEPVPEGADAETASHIIGVQGNLWTEYIAGPSLAEYQVLPRMGALSEVQWRPQGQKDFENYKVRQTRMLKLYDAYGLIYAKHMWKRDKKK